MSEHTKGPWKVDELASGNMVVGNNSVATAHIVGNVYIPREEHKANARLIAAAPDFYQLALELQWAYVDDDAIEGRCPICTMSRNQGHASGCSMGEAIAKAESK